MPIKALAVKPPASAPAARFLLDFAFTACMFSSCLNPGERMLYATQPKTGPNTAKKMSGRPSSAVCINSCAASARSAKNMEAAVAIAAVYDRESTASRVTSSVIRSHILSFALSPPSRVASPSAFDRTRRFPARAIYPDIDRTPVRSIASSPSRVHRRPRAFARPTARRIEFLRIAPAVVRAHLSSSDDVVVRREFILDDRGRPRARDDARALRRARRAPRARGRAGGERDLRARQREHRVRRGVSRASSPSVDRVAPAIRTVGGYERISTSIVVFRGFLMVICKCRVTECAYDV